MSRRSIKLLATLSLWCIALLFTTVLSATAYVYAAQAPTDLLSDYPSLTQWLYGAGVAVIAFFLNRSIRQNDENNKQQWAEIKALRLSSDKLHHRMAVLEAEHRVRTEDARRSGGRRDYDPPNPPHCSDGHECVERENGFHG